MKKPGARPGRMAREPRNARSAVAVVADGFDRAAFEGFHALGDFFFGGRLLMDERIATLVIAREEIRSSLAAQVAVDALLVDVEFPGGVRGPFVCFVRHRLSEEESYGQLCQAGRLARAILAARAHVAARRLVFRLVPPIF